MDYRRLTEYSEERLEETRQSLGGFYRFFERYQRITGESFYELTAPKTQADFAVSSLGKGNALIGILARLQHFLECMDDDFNTGGAIGFLFEILNALNRHADDLERNSENKTTAKDLAELHEEAIILRELGEI